MSEVVQLPVPATWDDLLAIPEDERQHEVLNGELVAAQADAPPEDGGSSSTLS